MLLHRALNVEKLHLQIHEIFGEHRLVSFWINNKLSYLIKLRYLKEKKKREKEVKLLYLFFSFSPH